MIVESLNLIRQRLKSVPFIISPEKNFFYFKKFKTKNEMYEYAGKMFIDFTKIMFLDGKENEFLQKYVAKPFNRIFQVCNNADRIKLLENYIQGNFFLGHIFRKLKKENLKKMFKKNYEKNKKTLEEIKKPLLL